MVPRGTGLSLGAGYRARISGVTGSPRSLLQCLQVPELVGPGLTSLIRVQRSRGESLSAPLGRQGWDRCPVLPSCSRVPARRGGQWGQSGVTSSTQSWTFPVALQIWPVRRPHLAPEEAFGHLCEGVGAGFLAPEWDSHHSGLFLAAGRGRVSQKGSRGRGG